MTTDNNPDTQVEIELPDGSVILVHWPFCRVDGCFNRICLGRSEVHCYIHSGGKQLEQLKKLMNKTKKKAKVQHDN